MTTATEYRQFAQECIVSARDATTEPIRNQFLELAKLWMTAAERLDASSNLPLPIEKLDGHRPPPGSVGAE